MTDQELDDMADRSIAAVKSVMFDDVRDSLAACLRIVDGLEIIMGAYGNSYDKAYSLLEDKTTIIARAREVSAKAAKIGGD